MTHAVTEALPTDLNRLERKRDLAREEIDAWLADHETAIRHATASIGLEIAAQLRDELRELEAEALGTPEQRLDAIAQALGMSDDSLQRIAGKLVETAALIARAEEP